MNSTRELRPRWSAFFLMILACGSVVSCVTHSVVQPSQPPLALTERRVRIEPCQNRTGDAGGRDLNAEATQALTEKVKASRRFELTADAPLVLTCDIEEFAEGSALKRWVMPGWGSTQAGVAVILWEQPGDKLLATFRSRTSVSSGGLFTIGADQYIIGAAFDDIIKQMETWASGATPARTP